MELKIKHGDSELYVKGLEANIETVKELYKMVCGEFITATALQPLEIQKLQEIPKTVSPSSDSFNIRERIPNNVVDVANLDVQQAVTENALVRCPKCGQAHCLIVKDNTKMFLMRRDFEKNIFDIVAEFDADNQEQLHEAICNGGEYYDYYQLLQESVMIDSSNFAVDNHTEIFCPVCHQSDVFMSWKDAYENPLHYFETENICDVCGNEMNRAISKNCSNILICEKCGWQKKIKG